MRSMLVVLAAIAATVVSGGPAAAEQARKAPALNAPIATKAQMQRIARGYAAANRTTKVYVVQMAGEPAARYAGGISGFAKSAPAYGQRYDARSGEAQMYAARLGAQQDALLRSVGAGERKIYSYRHAMNGFAARLSSLEAAKLRKNKAVQSVWEDKKMRLDTNNTPTFLGLLDKQEGLRAKHKLRGKGVIIGMMDSGAVQEHPSFDDTGMDAPPAHWAGICQPGEGWDADDCNNKLIGARYFNAGFLASGPMEPTEFLSARDSDGHGTHTATTAAGREVTASLNGTPLAKISGMAPDAWVAIYKPCWEDLGGDVGAGCFFSDSAAATDAAVADGVDLLSFSVGTAFAFNDPQDIAFLNAVDAGVFVSRSAGNEGPGPSTTAAGEPWVTTVAASTHVGTAFANGTKVNSPAAVAGTYASLEGGFTAPLVDVGPLTGDLGAANPIDACAALPAGSLTGKIALIARGTCNFDVKIPNAFNAGAIGAIVYSQAGNPKTPMGGVPSPQSAIPAVMIDNEPGVAILAQLTGGATVNATLSASVFVKEKMTGKIMADFSSRGPYPVEPNWIKPDVTAPGVRILAGNTPEPNTGIGGDFFQYLQGTSMSTPHVSGIAALIIEEHPDWSPAQVKSAIMTTARKRQVLKEDGVTPADPFDFGSGHIIPNATIDPGLTYDAALPDYIAASCGTVLPLDTPEACAALESAGYSLDPANLNLPSIGINNLIGSKTVRRTVTNVGKKKATYEAGHTAPPGFKVRVKPSSLTLLPGESKSYELTVTHVSAPNGEWRFGQVVWRDGKGHEVRSPIAVNAQTFVAPAEITGTGSDGSTSFDVNFGYNGAYTAGKHGIVEPFAFGLTDFPDDPDNTFDASGDPAQGEFVPFIAPIADGTVYAQFSLFNQYTDGDHDFDLYLLYCPADLTVDCAFLDASLNAGSDERIGVQFPIPDDPASEDDFYAVFMHAFQTEGGLPAAIAYLDWADPGAAGDEGNMTVNGPASAVAGTTESVDVSWTGLSTGALSKQVGAISHSDANGVIGLTTIQIANDEGLGFCDIPGACAP